MIVEILTLCFCHQATDIDLLPNNLISFSISDGNPLNNFTMNEETGEIFVNSPLDYEAMDSSLEGRFYMQIMARDGGTPSLSSFTNVTLFVQVRITLH